MIMEISRRREQPVPVVLRAWRGLGIARKPSGDQRTRPGLITAPADLVPGLKEVLFVDPDPEVQRAAEQALRSVAVVEFCSDFADARARLLAKPPDLLVTNVRLQAHNGLHLVHLARAAGARTRCVVYATEADLALACDAQAAGAFFVRAPRLALALQSYATAKLPRCDQRDPTVVDRRQSFRGGRRCTDS
jgi:CheY-like chemotaxis protein